MSAQARRAPLRLQPSCGRVGLPLVVVRRSIARKKMRGCAAAAQVGRPLRAKAGAAPGRKERRAPAGTRRLARDAKNVCSELQILFSCFPAHFAYDA